MKNLKFRQWNPRVKMFHFWGYIDGDDTFTAPIHGESQKFTGLSDKQGKEIYEGDIVQYDKDNPDVKPKVSAPVYFRNGAFFAGKGIGLLLSTVCHVVEVVGNIYEHKELLK
jgi:hypothetical protein